MNMTTEHLDPVPGAIRQLVGFFCDELSDIEFPDVSVQTLESHITRVETQATEVERLRDQLALARQRLDDERRTLSKHADVAIAYARIYAQSRPQLQETLGGLELAKPSTSSTKPKRKKRAPTNKAAPELPIEASTRQRKAVLEPVR